MKKEFIIDSRIINNLDAASDGKQSKGQHPLRNPLIRRIFDSLIVNGMEYFSVHDTLNINGETTFCLQAFPYVNEIKDVETFLDKVGQLYKWLTMFTDAKWTEKPFEVGHTSAESLYLGSLETTNYFPVSEKYRASYHDVLREYTRTHKRNARFWRKLNEWYLERLAVEANREYYKTNIQVIPYPARRFAEAGRMSSLRKGQARVSHQMVIQSTRNPGLNNAQFISLLNE